MTNSWEKMEFIQNCGCKKADGSGCFFNNSWRHDDIMLLPEIINMLPNFLFLSDTLLFEYFSRYCYFEGKL